MKDELGDLAADILKSRCINTPKQDVRMHPVQHRRPDVSRPGTITKGEGGLVFNFGWLTGNPVADNTTRLLQQFADPVQEQIARDQRRDFSKAMSNFIATGEVREGNEGVHSQWHDQLSKSMDQQVTEAIKKGEITVDSNSDPKQHISGDFNKSQMVLKGETIVAQSETDAAVIEMMKSMQDAEGSDGEFVIDATEG